jgi:hypothetical protein
MSIIAVPEDSNIIHRFNSLSFEKIFQIETKGKIHSMAIPKGQKEYLACSCDKLSIQLFDGLGREILSFLPMSILLKLL